jgi:uncharacterized FlaG/YvyC family protein
MDVPVANGAPSPAPIPPPSQPAPTPTPAPVPVLAGGSSGSSVATTATRALTASGAPSTPASNQASDNTLSPVVAKLFNTAASNVSVSFQVSTNPDEVVTVFTDKATGKEIIQFPSQALIALAQMYDKDAGKVLDKSV